MNKVFICFLLVLALPTLLNSQNSLVILKYEGEPYTMENNISKNITNGTSIGEKTKLVLNKLDKAYIINNKGEVFKLQEAGTYKFKDLLKLSPQKSSDSYSKKLMTYLWKEFTNSLSTDSRKSGVVYRGDFIQLLSPKDSISLYSNEISFEWEAKEGKIKPYYFVVREVGSEYRTMIGTYDTKVVLFVDNINLNYGGNYEWSVVESKYENLNSIQFSRFKILTEEEYKIKDKEIKTLSSFLTSLSYNKKEIENIICDYYKFCL
jgi:hypothetical protein